MRVFTVKQNRHPKCFTFIFAVLVLLGVLGVFFAFPASAQGTKVTIILDQAEYQVADFTVEEDITIYLSGNVTITSESALSTTVWLGIHAPDGWVTSISPQEFDVPLGTTTTSFEGQVTPSDTSEQKEYDISVWASAESRDFSLIDFDSPASDRGNILLNVITNRVKLLLDNATHKVLPDSIVDFTFEVTNVATVSDTFFINLINDETLKDQGWIITQSAEEVALEPGESETVIIQQQIPLNVPEGDYKIEVWISSEGDMDSKQSLSLTSKVRLPETSSPFRIDWMLLFMVGFVISGISLAAFFAATEYGYLAFISLFLPLYVRLKKKDVLSHFTRGQIFGYIQANPGTHYNAIIQDLNLHNGVGAYHLQVLEREGFIRPLKDGIYKRFYPSSMRIPEKKLHLSRIQRDILGVIQKHPGVTQKQISKLLDESKQVVHYHIKILESSGLIKLERAGRETACFAGQVKYMPDEDVYETADEKGIAQGMRM